MPRGSLLGVIESLTEEQQLLYKLGKTYMLVFKCKLNKRVLKTKEFPSTYSEFHSFLLKKSKFVFKFSSKFLCLEICIHQIIFYLDLRTTRALDSLKVSLRGTSDVTPSRVRVSETPETSSLSKVGMLKKRMS
jgi:hypothetical protein